MTTYFSELSFIFCFNFKSVDCVTFVTFNKITSHLPDYVHAGTVFTLDCQAFWWTSFHCEMWREGEKERWCFLHGYTFFPQFCRLIFFIPLFSFFLKKLDFVFYISEKKKKIFCQSSNLSLHLHFFLVHFVSICYSHISVINFSLICHTSFCLNLSLYESFLIHFS